MSTQNPPIVEYFPANTGDAEKRQDEMECFDVLLNYLGAENPRAPLCPDKQVILYMQAKGYNCSNSLIASARKVLTIRRGRERNSNKGIDISANFA